MPRARRGVQAVKTALRVIWNLLRNLLAVLGALFAILLIVSYMQYEDRLDAGDTGCTLTHCA